MTDRLTHRLTDTPTARLAHRIDPLERWLHHPDAGLLLVRAMLALVFLFHGAQKLFGILGGGGIAGTAGFFAQLGIPAPELAAVLAGAAELGGGLALATGLLFRPLLVPLAFAMLVAAVTAHSGFDAGRGGMEYPLTLAIVVVGLLLTGPGRFTLLAPLRARLHARDATASAAAVRSTTSSAAPASSPAAVHGSALARGRALAREARARG